MTERPASGLFGLRRRVERASAALVAPVDIASVAAFRLLFGVLLVVTVARYFSHGWIHAYFEAPKVFFPHYGFAWLRPLPAPWMRVVYGVMGLSAVGFATGTRFRLSAVTFFVTFTYAHVLDKTNYLNHYYLVILLAFLSAFLPLGDSLSVDARLRRRRVGTAPRTTVPAWVLYLLRFQVGVVYVFGGFAKLEGDWLFYAEPLSIWLRANTDIRLLGRLFASKATAYAMSYAGAAFDLSIVPLLLWRRSRALAYAALVGFHLITARLFQIGMFPWIMMASAPLFFSPSWPRRYLPIGPNPALPAAPPPARLPRPYAAALMIYGAVQLAIPLRHWLYPGSMLWTEEGFRFAWNVMLIEKAGVCELTVKDPNSARTFTLDGAEYLTRYQRKMVATQPDMIVDFARMVADDFRRRGVIARPQVFATAYVSLNGRPPQLLVDPAVDLAQEHDGLAPKRWILPLDPRISPL